MACRCGYYAFAGAPKGHPCHGGGFTCRQTPTDEAAEGVWLCDECRPRGRAAETDPPRVRDIDPRRPLEHGFLPFEKEAIAAGWSMPLRRQRELGVPLVDLYVLAVRAEQAAGDPAGAKRPPEEQARLRTLQRLAAEFRSCPGLERFERARDFDAHLWDPRTSGALWSQRMYGVPGEVSKAFVAIRDAVDRSIDWRGLAVAVRDAVIARTAAGQTAPLSPAAESKEKW